MKISTFVLISLFLMQTKGSVNFIHCLKNLTKTHSISHNPIPTIHAGMLTNSHNLENFSNQFKNFRVKSANLFVFRVY